MRFQNRLVLLACSVLLCFLSDILFRFPTVRSFQIPDYPESILYQEFFFNIQNEKMCILLSNDRFNVGCSREAYDNAVLVPVETEDHMQDLKKRLSESEMQYAVILSSSYYGTRGLSETISIFNNTSTVVGVYINRLKDESTPEKSGAQPNFMYPNASGINWNYYTFSLILLDDDATFDQVMFRAKENFQKAYEGLLTRIEQNYVMNAIGQNATTCLNNETCSPLGSHSVWAATKPVTHNTLKQQYVVLATKITSTSLFHQEVPAVRDVIAPLAAVLSVVESLLHFPVFTDETQKDVLPIVFAFFSGEEYDRLGSQRFVEEVGKFSCEEPGYNQDYPRHACINPWYRHTNFTDFRLDHIRYFIEMGPISLSNNSYYIMEPPEKSENTDTRRALEEAFAHIGAKASESSAFPRDYAVTSFENIGERAIYTEFQHEDPSSVHQTIYDTSKAVCTECIQRHATNLLHLLTTLTGAASVLGEENLGTLTVNPSLVTKWMLCLTDGTYDACPEVLNYLNITVLGTLEDPHSVLIPKTFYPGVFEFGRVSVVPQFLQVFLADKFALRRGAPCLEDDLELACSGAEMCVLGQCVLAESYLQHAYATSIRFNATSGTFSALPGISNGTWTESFWSAGVGSRVFHAESSKKEAGYLFGAIGSCVLVVLLLFLHENYAIPLIQK